MVAKIQILRSITPGNRPAGHTYGEPYVNFGDNQFGVFDSSNVARDLLGVPMFSSSLSYIAGAGVNYQGAFYIAKAAVPAAAWNPTQWFQPLQQVVLGGKLSVVSATSLKFVPYKGNYVKINGVLYPIPVAGIAGLASTNIFLNNVAGRNLGSAYYIVCVFNNAGVLTADYLTGYTHTPSTTVGNEGVEVPILSGTQDPSRSVIGLIYATSGQFLDTLQYRYTRSWFNEHTIHAALPNFQSAAITGTANFGAIGSAVGFVTWQNELVDMGGYGIAYNDTAGNSVYTNLLIDGAVPGGGSPFGVGYTTSDAANSFGSIAPHATYASGEGFHTAQLGAFVSGGSGTVQGYIRLLLSGSP